MKAEKVMLSVGFFFLRLAILILVIVGIYTIGEYSYMYCYSIVSDAAMEAKPGRDVSVTLTSNMEAKDAAQLLERKGLVEDANMFRIQLKINEYEDALEPGTYILNTSMTPKEMMELMSGKVVEEEDTE